MEDINKIWFECNSIENIKIKNEWVILIGSNSQNYWSLYVNNKKLFFFCIYKMLLKITKETWGKCGIATVKYNKKEDVIELWQKMNDVKKETGH